MPLSTTSFSHLGLDRAHLHQVRDRFIALNKARLTRTREALSDRAQYFLDCLPMLLQFNHPMLPGFVSRSTPSGLEGFEPERADILRVQSIAKSFRPNREPAQHSDIIALYLMGSVGTIAQSNSSDLDIWVCHRHDLSPAELTELRLKCEYLQQWAGNINLEVHFFLMNWQTVQTGKLSALDGESSGTTQYFLLLDEFYRTAIHLAGRLPTWIFVPIEHENHYDQYANILTNRRFLPERQLIDFGGIASIPVSEFLSAAIWQLYKAIESPYKSVIKLLLLESYANQLSSQKILSHEFKQFLHKHNQRTLSNADLNYIDPYIQTYNHLENYLLTHKQADRLELVRRCFYFKVNKPLTKPMTGNNKSWQREELEKMVTQWGWSNNHLSFLDRHKEWKVSQILTERKILIAELNKSYRFLLNFWQQQKTPLAATTQELNILGRKLNAAFSRKKGKVDWLNPAISDFLSETYLTFCYKSVSNHSKQWHVYNQRINDRPFQESRLLLHKPSLIEIMTWCHCNGVMGRSTRCDSTESAASPELIDKIRHSLAEVFSEPLTTAPHSAFQQASHYKKIVLFINTEAETNNSTQTLRHISAKVDALNFGGWNKLLIDQIDLVTINSWNEIHCHQYKKNAVIETLQHFISVLSNENHHTMPELNVYCYSNDHRLQIQQRLTHLFTKLHQIFNIKDTLQHASDLRYIIEIAGNFHIIKRINRQITIDRYKNLNQLLQALSAPQQYSGIKIDDYALSNHPLHTITQYIEKDTIHVFFESLNEQARLYIVDENGSLFSSTINYTLGKTSLRPLHHFLRNIIEQRLQQRTQGPLGIYPIHFYELDYRQGHWQCSQRPITTNLFDNYGFNIRASAEFIDGSLCFSIFCDEHEFTNDQDQPAVFAAAAAYILHKREQEQRYHCYITDVDLSRCYQQLNAGGELQTIHYLNIKSVVERKINLALQQL